MFRLPGCHGTILTTFLALVGGLAAQIPAETEDIRGPKPMVDIPAPEKVSWDWWIGFAAGLVVVLITWIIWNKLAARKKAETPREKALASLRELEGNRRQLSADDFANSAARTVRGYIAARFGLAAPRRTTEEFLRELAKDGTSSLAREKDHLKTFLNACDLAKFAGSNLDELQREDLLQAARGFILASAPPGQPPSAP